MHIDEPARRHADREEMYQYYRDPDAFRQENEALNAAMGLLRQQYDLDIVNIRPALENMFSAAQPYPVRSLHLLLPSVLRRITNLVATALSAGLNFMRETVDQVIDHVQRKVAHFHHALLVVGDVVDERLTQFAHRLQGMHLRVRGLEHQMGITSEQATSRRTSALPDSETIMGRLLDVEAKLQHVRGELLLLNLKITARALQPGADRCPGADSRAPSPSAASDRSRQSEFSGASGATSSREALDNLRHARARQNVPAMIAAAQDIAFFERTP